MTNEQAIKYLQESKCDGTINYTHQEMHNTALDIAIQALEKQIPKRVIYHHDNIHKHYSCESCGLIYFEKEFVGNYCNSCGQKLESDTE